MLGLSDVEQIASALKTYGIADTAKSRANIKAIWTVWPIVANEFGGYTKSNTDRTLAKNAVSFRAKLAALTKVPSSMVTLIASAIVDTANADKLSAKSYDPQTYKAIASAESALKNEIVASGGGSIMDRMLSIGTTLKSAWPWIKWGGIGLGILALLFLGRPYLQALLKVIPKRKGTTDGD